MLKIRLKRVGRKHDPSYRIVVTEDFRGPKSGKYIEKVGNYDPKKDTKEVNADRVRYWISKGAKVSDTVHNILVSEKVVEGSKKNVVSEKKLNKNKDKKQEEEKKEEVENNTEEIKDKPKEEETEKKEEDGGKVEEIIEDKTEETKEEDKKE